ncbi:hypothetical protein TPL01_25660 [Sulfuriferula plumbiphila]|uniref:SpoVT-AbrB domain-containing protein n=1 Tax=Sulfuriferula plumbiphila TaxID=171865 RepID=A0A512LAB1_9PROT|nr:AbrB/MazE/SpoVT family DNA-binding domain-containing protein [Sulfuriferula plumbiphila]BBP03128.1 hypothetical protein SFPGR_05500 [Sulfuriferula plumbiphila]GEP31428.1 hypothetical protein TPL01_25660 [Sulfuriferula plumbiphila]
MLTSKVTSKYQATIPAEVRKKLGIHSGDTLAFEVVNDEVRLRRATPLDLQYAQALAATLGEWDSASDTEAYREL